MEQRDNNNQRNNDTDGGGEEVDDEDEDVDVVGGVFDMLNIRIVPREPVDQGYSPMTYLPDENRVYARELIRLRNELAAKDVQHREELIRANARSDGIAKDAQRRIAEEKGKTANLEKANSRLEEDLKKTKDDKNGLELQNKKISAIVGELDLALQAQKKKTKGLSDEIQKLKKTCAGKEEHHKKEKEKLQQSISELEHKISEYKDAALQRQTEFDLAQKKVLEQQGALDKLSKEKANVEAELKITEQKVSEQQLQLNDLQATTSTLRNQVEEQAAQCEQYKAELNEAKKTINVNKVDLKKAEALMREQKKVMLEGEDNKKKLEKLLQTNRHLDAMVANLNGGVTDRQREIDRLDQCLIREREESSNAQVKFRSLRDSVFRFNAEFSTVVQGIGNVAGVVESNSQQHEPGSSNGESDMTVESILESLKVNLESKINWWKENQKSMKAKLAKTTKDLEALYKLLDSRKRLSITKSTTSSLQVGAPPPPTPHASSSSSSTFTPNNVTKVTNLSFRDVAKRSALATTTTTLSQSPQQQHPVNPPFNAEKESAFPPLGSAHLSPSKRYHHGINYNKRRLGWYCICDDSNNFKSRESLRVHLNYLLNTLKFKCFICSQRFSVIARAKLHLLKSHNVVIRPVKLNCWVCGKTFGSWEQLYLHKTIHTVQRCKKYLQSKSRAATVCSPLKTLRAASPKPIKISLKKISADGKSRSQWNIVSSTSTTTTGDVNENVARLPGNKQARSNPSQINAAAISQSTSASQLLNCTRTENLISPCTSQKEQENVILADPPPVAMILPSQRLRKNNSRNPLNDIESSATKTSIPTSMPFPISAVQIKMEQVEETNLTNCTSSQNGSSSEVVNKKHGFDRSKKARAGAGHYCLCGRESKTIHQLKEHIFHKTAVKRFFCPVCDKAYIATNYLRKHVNSAHKMEYHYRGCRRCGSLFRKQKDLYNHIKAKHPPPVILVIDLSKEGNDDDGSPAAPRVAPFDDERIVPPPQSSSSTSIKKSGHVQKHAQDNSKDGFVCCCGIPLSDKQQLEQHILTFNHSAKQFECNICKQRHWKLGSLHKHLVQDHNVSVNKLRTKDLQGCTACGQLCKSKLSLRRHVERCHPPGRSRKPVRTETESNSVLVPPVSMVEDPNICQPVGDESIQKSLFTQALGLRPTVPTVSKKSHAIDVSKRHIGYYCVCGTKCRKQDILNRHIKYFNGEGEHKCPLCAHCFLFFSQLKKHLNVKHKIKTRQQLKNLGIGQNEGSVQHTSSSSSSSGNRTRPLVSVKRKSKSPAPHLSPPISSYSPILSPSSVPPPKLSPQKFSSELPLSSSAAPRLNLHGEHRLVEQNSFGYFCTCGEQFLDFFSIRSHILNPSSRAGPSIVIMPTGVKLSAPRKLTRSPLMLLPTPHGQNTTFDNTHPFNIKSSSVGSGGIPAAGTPIASSSHYHHSSPKHQEENDMIVDAHLAFENYQPSVPHGIDRVNASVGHFCLCGNDFSKKRALNRHIKYHYSKRRFICHTCRNGFLTVAQLRNHLLVVHKIVYNFSNGCKDCGATFSTNMELYRHFRIVHNRGAIWEQEEPRDIKYVPPTTPRPVIDD